MSDYLIPEDCLLEILKRLPVKSLARFRCVCRGWNVLICSSSFITYHHAFCKSKPHLFISNAYQKPSKHNTCAIFDSDSSAATFVPHITGAQIPVLRGPYCYEIVGSAKGIICIRGESSEILSWNLVVNKYIRLPKTNTGSVCFSSCVMSIAIGLKPSEEDDLRVLRISLLKTVVVAEIYSVRQGDWRVLHANTPCCLDFCYDYALKPYANGAVHWVAWRENGGSRLIRFGFEEEEFSCITLPDALAKSRPDDLHVSVYRGRLALLQQHYVDSTYSHLKIWTRDGNEDSWSVIICTDPLQYENNYIYGITHDGQILMSRLNYKGDDDLLLYNSTIRTCRQLDMHARRDGRINVCPFAQSLVFINGEGGALTLPPRVSTCPTSYVIVRSLELKSLFKQH